jgi:hypothetical protein
VTRVEVGEAQRFGCGTLSAVAQRSSSELRVDRQELQKIGDKAPAESGCRLVAVTHTLAVPYRLPDDLADRIEVDALAVGGHDASRHVDR